MTVDLFAFPLSYAQERLWFLDQLQPGMAAYNIGGSVRLRGALNVGALEHAIVAIVARHESLRTTFRIADGSPVQVVASQGEIRLAFVELSGVPESNRESTAVAEVSAEAQRPFELGVGPLFRPTLYRLAPDDHILLLCVHHIIFDGWSFGILARELVGCYEAYAAGRQPTLPELPIQYADYTEWQRDYLRGDLLANDLAYWRQKLAGIPPVLELPRDYPRPTMQGFQGAKVALTLSASLHEGLRRLSVRQGATLFMTLLAAFTVLLQRYAGQEDVVVGTPITNRNRRELEGLIGLFVNTLVLRTDLAGDPSFCELLARVRETCLDAYAHQNMPFEKLVEELRPERDLGRNPLFQVFFNMLERVEQASLDLPGLQMEMYGLQDTASKFDLTLYVADRRDTLSLLLVYNADLFSESRMSELLGQYDLLLQQVVERPDVEISAHSLITQRARKLLPDPARLLDNRARGSIHGRVAERAFARPQNVAIDDGRSLLAYGDLERRSNRLGHWLRNQGLCKGDVVGVYAQRNASLVCALLGILKAGGAFTVLDPTYPAARLAECWRVASPRGLLLVERAEAPPTEIEHVVPGSAPRFRLRLSADGREPELADIPETDPGLTIGPDDLAYVAFTSGSTGGVKAVLGTHGPVVHFLDWHIGTFGLREDDRYSMLSGLSHDPLLRDVFTPLWLGATLCIPTIEEMGDPGWLAGWMARLGVTVTHLTPAMGQWLGDGLGKVQFSLDALRYAFFGGDVLGTNMVRLLQRLGPNVTCVNFYGATETPQAMASFVVPSSAHHTSEMGREIIPLGKGIEGVQLLVLTQGRRLAGVGELGEIAIRTPHLSRGYLGEKALNQARFVINPFTGAASDRFYLTGDLGRYLPDGNVEFCGRVDTQVKLRGFRIELGEVDAVLREHPSVVDAVTVLREDTPEHTRLVGYVVGKRGARPDTDALRAFLRENLPAFSIPSAFVGLDALPLTPNGKVDQEALPAPEATGEEGLRYVAPRTQTEEIVAGVWSAVLHLGRVGIHDNFFEVGGHSLLATQVVSRLREAFGDGLELRVVFEKPTVAELARHLEIHGAELRRASTPKIVPVPRGDVQPCSYSQERMWFVQQLNPETLAYNMNAAVRVGERVDADLIRRTFLEIVRRHEVLRTTFDAVDGQPRQRIAAEPQLDFATDDLRRMPPGEREREVARLVNREAQRVFDLERGPLLRIFLFTLDDEDHVLLLSMHHIVADLWSYGVIGQEYHRICDALRSGVPVDLPELPVQYVDYAHWQRRWLSGETLGAQIEYWKGALAGTRVLELATDRPRPAIRASKGARLGVEFPRALSDALQARCVGAHVTPFMFLLAVFKLLLWRYSGQEDITVGAPIANRTCVETEGLIGTFVNTLVLRSDLSGDPTFRAFLDRVRETCLRAYAHQDVPFEKVVEEVQPERDLSHAPLIQVLFNVANAPIVDPARDRGNWRPFPVERGAAQFDLTMVIGLQSGLQVLVEYDVDLFDGATIENMLRHYRNLLESLLENPDQPLSAVPLLDPAEWRRMTQEWNDTAVGFPGDNRFVHMFESQAEKTPAAVAVVCAADRLTYGELNRRANRLAYRLRALGAGPDVFVAVFLERSVEMLTVLVAILKASAAYLPLDPAFPTERLAFMLGDARASILVTQESLATALPTAGMAVVRVDCDGGALECASEDNPASRAGADDLAYVIYTSGSTGRPKGVQISHRALGNLLCAMRDTPGLRREDVLLAVTTLSFDIAGLELLLPLIVGATVVLGSRDVVANADMLAERIDTSGATVLQATPATWRMLIEAGWKGAPELRALCGGEALSRELADDLLRRCGSVWNMYGPTETTIWSSVWKVEPGGGPILIGRPIANTRFYILDARRQPRPIGVPGELYIGGAGVARGYLNRAELTAERFVADPFTPEVGALMYRTGDLARYLPDGRVQCLGRIDHQVKIRGYRIELGEIEAVLEADPAVKQAVAWVREDAPGDKRLVAYVVPGDGQALSVDGLRSRLALQVPEYMVPSAFVVLAELPLTPNGKVDRRALPAPGGDGTLQGDAPVLPRTPVEETVAAIWRDVLGLERIGVHDNFFHLGGHSLLVTRVVARLRQVLGVELPLRAFFEAPTVAGLAGRIVSLGGAPWQPARLSTHAALDREEFTL